MLTRAPELPRSRRESSISWQSRLFAGSAEWDHNPTVNVITYPPSTCAHIREGRRKNHLHSISIFQLLYLATVLVSLACVQAICSYTTSADCSKLDPSLRCKYVELVECTLWFNRTAGLNYYSYKSRTQLALSLFCQFPRD